MRKMLIAGASAAVLCLSGGGAFAMAGSQSPGLRGALDSLNPRSVAWICRDVCRDGVCGRRCWEDDDNVGYYDRRRVYRNRYRDRDDYPRRYERRYYDDGPGVQLRFDLD